MSKTPGRAGLFSALRDTGVTLLTMLQTRLELLGNEFEAQKLAIIRMLLLSLAIVYCASMGVVVILALVTVAFWEYRIAVLGGFAVFFIIAAFACYRTLMRIVQDPEPPFSATLGELREDMRRLQAATHHHAETRD